MDRRWTLAIIGLILILAGGVLAWLTQTSGGIQIRDVRFPGANGITMRPLLYVPANATAQRAAPGILAVRGYINSRETQDGFAIEFARRGYVVLALDQTGHGYSDGPAFANGFGGPDGLAYLRSLAFVDKDNIGLEGHSMGGWTVLAAATAMPNGVRRTRRPGFASSIIQIAPSGATSASRTRNPMFQRCTAFAPPLPSNVIRVSDIDARPVANADPFHCGNIAPL